CLREGLLAHRFLRLAGFDPDLRFGVDPQSMHAPRLSAHCWVCLDGRPVVSDSLPGMVEIYRHHAESGKARAA
ncbi:MAG: lasso peptide biosynthesis B2 protein, partial [Mesorhizobium sp.]